MGQQTTDHCHPDALLVGQVGEALCLSVDGM